ncbi:hypothetical protein BDZ94DRAFT_1254533 [Collybia nuda]|uniref:Uncharacterized protein n=1 Tax=Collybia nuda TaxID=64659 RepID=A0A9P6CGD3_9AGAR|nr:hypothetical protein BDZ94DRAFT_1254533 [Collybia nuda]
MCMVVLIEADLQLPVSHSKEAKLQWTSMLTPLCNGYIMGGVILAWPFQWILNHV